MKTVTIQLEVKERLGKLKREMSLYQGRKYSYMDVLQYLLSLAEDDTRWRVIRQ